MLVARVNPLSNKLVTMEIPITEGQYYNWLISRYNSRLISNMPIQQTFPWLSEDHCEFLMTGLTPEDWANIFNK